MFDEGVDGLVGACVGMERHRVVPVDDVATCVDAHVEREVNCACAYKRRDQSMSMGLSVCNALFQYQPNPAFVWNVLYSQTPFGITDGATWYAAASLP